MNLLEVLRVALLDLALHKFRSLLAVLGIIFGVASVEGMISISEGAKREAMRKFAALGINNILVRTVKPTRMEGKKDDAGSGRRAVLEYGLLRKDLDHIRRQFPMVGQASALREVRMNLYSQGGRELDLSVLATDPEFLEVTRSELDRGRFITDTDQKEHSHICVLGSDAARKLFGFRDPLNDQARIGNMWYHVVGVLGNHTSMRGHGGDDINNCVFIPLATAQATCGDLSYVEKAGSAEFTQVELDGVYIQMADTDAVLGAADRLFLKKRLPPQDPHEPGLPGHRPLGPDAAERG